MVDYMYHSEHPGGGTCTEPAPFEFTQDGVPKKVSTMTEDRGSFYDVWSQLIEREELHVSEVYPDTWIAIETWEQLKKANEG